MRKQLMLGAVLAALGFPTASSAQVQLGLRVGYAPANLQLGGDWKVSEKFAIGPYLTYSFGQYSSGETKVSGTGTALDGSTTFSDYASTSTHSWFGFGIVGKFDL